jgi:glutamyl-tRNA synthetase
LFRLEDVNLSPAFFDIKKLAAFNGEYIRMMPIDEFVAECDRWVPADWDRERLAAIATHIQPRLVTFSDLPGIVDFLFGDVVTDDDSWSKTMSTEYARPLLESTIGQYSELGDWSADVLKSTLELVMEPFGVKLGKAQAPVRVAVTGRTVGPPLFESIEVLGREETLVRLGRALEQLAT